MRAERLPFQKPEIPEEFYETQIGEGLIEELVLTLNQSIVRGPVPPDPNAGDICFREDLSAMFLFTGTRWVQIAPSERDFA